MSSSPQSEDFDDAELVILTDEGGRELPCYIERELELDSKVYLLLLPENAPIEIFAWDEEDDVTELVSVEEEEEIDRIFADAHAVLSEQNLTLKRTAFTLSAVGELPPLDPTEVVTIELDEDDETLQPEEFQILARFYNEEQEYAICTPVDPLLFFGKSDDKGVVSLLSEAEAEQLQPRLEDMLLDEI
ncbi:DUF3727 domain-containing protein [Chamaesiphon minutus]|uniref:DUF3727 domain-containing protein n=1 Tax=Chamaesiphon minutus (strain ATCC 27169 / PCC 6605) TaxID=1173020 RepID=K9UFZ5_CHAP6|nr:DUF3727 domain-containing protein [Chamaesiphon minutus]AFY93735.1 Protein of unknown function (DUF3727)/Protein of unknown function (DUF1292) [Chamaesiphon minutus PCC 6605]